MKRSYLLWVLVLAVGLVMPAVAGEYEKCKADTQTCLNKMVASLKERGWVGIEMDDSDGKLTITNVEPDSPAMESGLRPGDVLLAMNGISFSEKNQEKLYQVKMDMKVGKTVSYTVDRVGCCHIKAGEADVEITLGTIPETVIAKWVGGHMIQHAAIEMANN